MIDIPKELLPQLRIDEGSGRKSVIIAPLLGENDFKVHESPEGKPIDNFNGVFSPNLPLVLQEYELSGEPHEGQDRIFLRGYDERIEIPELSIEGLEFLINTIISRTSNLEAKSLARDDLVHFYPYATYNVSEGTLVGRLLGLNIVVPSIEDEIKFQASYYKEKRRVKFDDDLRVLDASKREKEHRLIREIGHFVSFIPYSPRDLQESYIIVRRVNGENISNIKELTEKQKRDLASLVYDSVHRTMRVADTTSAAGAEGRSYDTVVFAFHSAPNTYKHATPIPLSELYRFNVKMSPGEIPREGAPYIIPFADLPILGKRPKEIARSFRKSLNHHS